MPRRPRFCPAGIPVHVIQRGNNRQTLFSCDADIVAYANWLCEGADRFDVEIHGWVFMTNHVHLLVTPRSEHALSRFMQSMGRRYVGFFNHKYSRTGTLFEGRFRSCPVQEEAYFLSCLRYIELNPVRAGIVRDPADYRWSSHRAHAFGAPVKLWTPHALYQSLGTLPTERQNAWRELVGAVLDIDTITKIRHCTNTGLALGAEKFRDQVEKLRR